MIDVALCLDKLVPGAAYGGSLTEDSVRRLHGGDPAAAYRALRWEDARPRPSWAEIEAVWPEVEAELAAEANREPPPTPKQLIEAARADIARKDGTTTELDKLAARIENLQSR